MVVDVAVAVAVAGVITVGHGHENDQDHVYDHHRSLRLGERLDRGKARSSGPRLRLSRDCGSADLSSAHRRRQGLFAQTGGDGFHQAAFVARLGQKHIGARGQRALAGGR